MTHLHHTLESSPNPTALAAAIWRDGREAGYRVRGGSEASVW